MPSVRIRLPRIGSSPSHPPGPTAGQPLSLPRVSVRRLMLRFALAGLAALVVLTALTAVVSRRLGTAEAMDEARRIASIATNGVAQPAITPGLLRGEPDQIAAFDRVIRQGVLRGSLQRVKLWSPDGVIIYSDEPRLIGERFPLDGDKRIALAGGPAKAEVSDLSEPENRFEKPDTKLLEVYTRMVGPAGEPLLFETYFSFQAVTDSGLRLWLAFAPVAVGALVLLQLVQLPLAWSLAGRLRRGQDESEQLLWHAVESSNAERRRIAGDLHDGTVQDLAGVSIALSAAARRPHHNGPGQAEADRQTLQDAATQVRGAITELRSLLVEIYPPNLQAEGLESALNALVARLPARGVTPRLEVELPDTGLSPELSGLVYRCAQELVRNTLRHAGASTVVVRVGTEDDEVVLEVIDDGRGFDPRPGVGVTSDGHVGLQVLADLVARAGGTVEVASAPGRGTSTRVTVPA
jgi:two-component system NarL family sensor kinase